MLRASLKTIYFTYSSLPFSTGREGTKEVFRDALKSKHDRQKQNKRK